MIENTINNGIDAAISVIKFPVYVGRNIVWKSKSIAEDVAASSVRIPVRVTLRLAKRLSNIQSKNLSTKNLRNYVKKIVDEYEKEQEENNNNKSLEEK